MRRVENLKQNLKQIFFENHYSVFHILNWFSQVISQIATVFHVFGDKKKVCFNKVIFFFTWNELVLMISFLLIHICTYVLLKRPKQTRAFPCLYSLDQNWLTFVRKSYRKTDDVRLILSSSKLIVHLCGVWLTE